MILLFLIIIIIFGFFFIFKDIKAIKKLINNQKELNQRNRLLNFISYSQFYEDLILYSIFYDVINGFYIDIGANDPNHISVTKAFYNLGWNGINIEPLPEKFRYLLKYRKRDINLNIGVGATKENASFLKKGAGSKIVNNYSINNKRIMNISIDTMSNICKKYIPIKIDIQFCKIDVEGWEKNVLLGYDFENCRPKVFCIESTYPGTKKPCHQLWEKILLKYDYSFAYQYKITIYILIVHYSYNSF